MKVVALANNRLEKGLQVPMAKVITLPLVIDGQQMGPFSVYVSASVFSRPTPTDFEVIRVARVIADAINKGTQS